MMVPIARSDIHVHLTEDHIAALFGPGAVLTVLKELTIPGQFASGQTVAVQGPAGRKNGVVVVGPARPYTQVEIAVTDGIALGIAAPFRYSGELEDTPGCTLHGPAGSLELESGVITARRHIHMHSEEAYRWGLHNGQMVSVRIPGPRGLIFNNVRIKAGEDQALEMHVDFDEGHAAGIEDFQLVEVLY